MEKPASGRAKQMAVKCAKCGEELLGAVNRCWRCGTEMESRTGDTSLPPVRRAPVPSVVESAPAAATDECEAGDPANADQVVEAALAAEVSTNVPSSDESPGQTAGAPPVVARRVGSPFATPVSAPGDGPTERPPTPKTRYAVRQAKYPRHLASAGGSIAALVLGILSLIACFYTAGAVITAVIGLLMGVWGLYSTRRGPAIIGILLCCIAMAIGGFNGVAWIYETQYGYKPWETPSDYDMLEDGYEEDVDNF